MRRLGPRWLKLWAACLALSVGSVFAIALAVQAALAPKEYTHVAAALATLGSLPYLLVILLAVGCAFVASWLVRTYFAPLAQARDATELCARTNPQYRIQADGPKELRELAAGINHLAKQYERTLADVESRVGAARADLEIEKNRLAVLMSQLAQGVVVCSATGVITLYNDPARRLFAGPVDAREGYVPAFIGLGRSLYDLMPSEPVRYAIERLEARTAAGELDPSVAFITALASGPLVRVRMAPMAGTGATPASGYVLLLEDVSHDVTGVEQLDRILIDLMERSRAALASLRAATENLHAYPDLDSERRLRFLTIALEEAKRLSGSVEDAAHQHAATSRVRPRALELLRAADLAVVLSTALGQIGLSVRTEPVAHDVWLDLDCHAMVQALRYLARRLHDEFELSDFALSIEAYDRHAYIDLGWLGTRLSGTTATAWETDPLSVGGEASSNTLREILQVHGGEIWHEIDRPSGRARFRIMLPLSAREAPSATPAVAARPVYYDFDLIALGKIATPDDDRPLQEMTYTVFDTETTGLDPSAGDEIISIGAVRIVNGRVLSQEIFEQLIDPRRPIDPQSARVHGISNEMLRGQPPIEAVLPRFHRFCAGTILVGHNVAFDLRFLQLKEQATGIVFRQPVLDTLLLSAVLHDLAADHRLEALAHRFGIEVVARHSAVGDAMVTADIFVNMLPLLAERGIRTLREAREAAERTRYAQLRY